MRGVMRQAMEWLAAAATDPRSCLRQWHGETGVSMLACGRFWDVLSVPEHVGVPALDALLGSSAPAPGPALADAATRRVGFFLPPDPSGRRWAGPGVRYLGRGAWIAAPAPHRASGRLRWLVPPDGTGTLFGAAAVDRALRQALGGPGTPARDRGRRPVPEAPSGLTTDCW